MNKIKNYINGNFTANSTDYLNVIDPSKGELINQVVLSNYKDFKSTIESSSKAFYKWSNETPLKRSRVLFKYKNLIASNSLSYIDGKNSFTILLYFIFFKNKS